MMTSFPNSPRLVKGAIVGVDSMNPPACVVVLRCDPNGEKPMGSE